MRNTVSSLLFRSLSRKAFSNHVRSIHATRVSRSVIVEDEKDGYPRLSDVEEEKKTIWQQARQGWRFLKEELKMWKGEMKEAMVIDPIIELREGEVDVQWRFEGDPSILDKWVVTADSDFGEGNSTASLQLTKTGRGLFTGTVDPRTFRDGRIKRSGYCNLTSVKLPRSFGRTTQLPWGPYTHLVMRVRGDGRNYLLVLSCPGEYDIFWNDSYHYGLYTRGGPYWQYVRIPFSKFFFVSHGRVQDIQQPPPTYNIATIGITAATVAGNFKLEIDYIGVECDMSHDEEHAYELYKTHKFTV